MNMPVGVASSSVSATSRELVTTTTIVEEGAFFFGFADAGAAVSAQAAPAINAAPNKAAMKTCGLLQKSTMLSLPRAPLPKQSAHKRQRK